MLPDLRGRPSRDRKESWKGLELMVSGQMIQREPPIELQDTKS